MECFVCKEPFEGELVRLASTTCEDHWVHLLCMETHSLPFQCPECAEMSYAPLEFKNWVPLPLTVTPRRPSPQSVARRLHAHPMQHIPHRSLYGNSNCAEAASPANPHPTNVTTKVTETRLVMPEGERYDCWCQICGDVFKNRTQKSRHMTKHRAPEIHRCPLCTSTFTTFTNMRKHQLKFSHLKKKDPE